MTLIIPPQIKPNVLPRPVTTYDVRSRIIEEFNFTGDLSDYTPQGGSTLTVLSPATSGLVTSGGQLGLFTRGSTSGRCEHAFAGGPQDLTQASMVGRYYVPTVLTGATSISMHLYDADGDYIKVDLTGAALSVGWHEYEFHTNSMVAVNTPTVNAMTGIRLSINGPEGLVYWLDKMGVYSAANAKPVCWIRCDWARKGVWRTIIPMMEARGLLGNIGLGRDFLETAPVVDGANVAHVRDMYLRGHDIFAYTANTMAGPVVATAAELMAVAADNRNYLIDKGYVRAADCLQIGGAVSTAIQTGLRPWMEQHFASVQRSGAGYDWMHGSCATTSAGGDGLSPNPPLGGWRHFKRVAADTGVATSQIDDAITYNAGAGFLFHGTFEDDGDAGYITKANLATFLDYVATKVDADEIECKTISQLMYGT